ncbi:MAG: hypothetical protein ACOYJC_00765 [Christensenellales bacterium]|jgi:hypothetical protein
MQTYIYDIPVPTDVYRMTYQVFRPVGAYLSMPITRHTPNTLTLRSGSVIESALLARQLAGCDEIVFIGVTVQGADALLQKWIKDSMAQTAELSGLFSNMVHEGITYIMGMLHGEALKNGRRMLKRHLSPGIDDFKLDEQKVIYDLLDLQKLDMHITPDHLLLPEKSAITVSGIMPGEEE